MLVVGIVLVAAGSVKTAHVVTDVFGGPTFVVPGRFTLPLDSGTWQVYEQVESDGDSSTISAAEVTATSSLDGPLDTSDVGSNEMASSDVVLR